MGELSQFYKFWSCVLTISHCCSPFKRLQTAHIVKCHVKAWLRFLCNTQMKNMLCNISRHLSTFCRRKKIVTNLQYFVQYYHRYANSNLCQFIEPETLTMSNKKVTCYIKKYSAALIYLLTAMSVKEYTLCLSWASHNHLLQLTIDSALHHSSRCNHPTMHCSS